MNKRHTKIIFLSAVGLSSLILFFGTHSFFGLSNENSSETDFQLLGKIISLIRDHYFEEPKPYQTMEGAFKGIINSLDTLSSYLDRDNAEKFRLQRETRLNETGMILYKKEYSSYPQVVGIIKGSPAEESGFQLGDLIIAIDDISTLTMSMLEANLNLKEKDQKDVKLRFIRGTQTQEMTVHRELLNEAPFSYTRHKGASGILRIHRLYPACVVQIREKVLPRVRSEKKLLILDLRNCHEGDIEEALKLTNLFLKSEEVGYFESRDGEKKILSCQEEPELEGLPLIIWTNQGTIGPAEAAAAVLREFGKAKILGFSTPGLAAKGNFFSLEDGSALLLTSGIFVLKSGKAIWGSGLTPDIKIQGQDQSDEVYLKETAKLNPGP